MKTRLTAALFATVLTSALCAGCDGDGDTVGPRGGTIASDDGRLSVEIPEGALSGEVEITIERVDEGPADALAPTYRIGPVGTAFARPATVTYEFGGDDMDGIDIDRLGLLVQRDGDWNRLADREVDVELEMVSASAVYLSSFTLVAFE